MHCKPGPPRAASLYLSPGQDSIAPTEYPPPFVRLMRIERPINRPLLPFGYNFFIHPVECVIIKDSFTNHFIL